MHKKQQNEKKIPINTKSHKMKTRKPLKYKVKFANTERLKKAAILYMQNLLNEQNMEK